MTGDEGNQRKITYDDVGGVKGQPTVERCKQAPSKLSRATTNWSDLIAQGDLISSRGV